MNKQLAIVEHLVCRKHNRHALAVRPYGEDDGSTRITGGKCCGSWSVAQTFRIDRDALEEIEMCLEQSND